MFDNIGEKIKMLAKAIFCVGVTASVVGGFVSLLIVGAGELGAILFVAIPAVGSLLSWASSLVIYGFGELVSNSAIIARKENDTKKSETSGTSEHKCLDAAEAPKVDVDK